MTGPAEDEPIVVVAAEGARHGDPPLAEVLDAFGLDQHALAAVSGQIARAQRAAWADGWLAGWCGLGSIADNPYTGPVKP